MGLFHKNEEKKERCCCAQGGPEKTEQAETPEAAAEIKVLGGGCARCNALEAAVKAALAELGRDTAIEHVTDFSQIAAYDVMGTPALVVDGRVVSVGRVLNKEEVLAILKR